LTSGEFPQGCTVFRTISPNVESEESGMRDDSGMQDVAYTEVDITLVNIEHAKHRVLQILYYLCFLNI